MLAELFASLTTPFPRVPRRLGFLAEQIAIRARERRCRAAWAPHLAASHARMLAAAESCPRRARCVVVGAGLCLDVPLQRLAALFDEVVLLDVGFLERGGPGNVRRIPWDATGALERWHADPAMDDAQALETREPGWPDGVGEPDLTISASILSQLHILPAAWLERGRPRPDGFDQRLADRLAGLHRGWLASRPGRRLLLADLAVVNRGPDGAETANQPTATARLGLPAPDAHWEWLLAPAPEDAADHDIVHQVGAWSDPP